MYLPKRPVSVRRGLSLLEVLVALAIFLLSFVAIGRLTSLASDRALDVEYQSQATRLAQSKLNEVVGGAVPLQGGSGTFDEDSDWHWSVDASQNDVANLWTVTVTVTRPSSGGEEISSTLTQMVLDPSIRGSVFDAVAVTGSADTAPSGGSNASGSGGSSGQGGAAGGGAMGGGAMGGGAGKGGGSMGGGSKGGGGGTMGGGSKSGGTTGGTGGGSKSGGGTTGGGSKGGAAAGGSKGG